MFDNRGWFNFKTGYDGGLIYLNWVSLFCCWVWFFDIRLAVSIIEFLSRRVQFQLKTKLIFYYFKFLKNNINYFKNKFTWETGCFIKLII